MIKVGLHGLSGDHKNIKNGNCTEDSDYDSALYNKLRINSVKTGLFKPYLSHASFPNVVIVGHRANS